MEESHKKQAEEFLSIMQHTHVTIKRLLEAGNYPLAMVQLEQCQSYALSFGQQMESTEGTVPTTITLLEDYCELVYRIYEELRCGLPVNPNDVHNSLAMQMIRVGNHMRDEN